MVKLARLNRSLNLAAMAERPSCSSSSKEACAPGERLPSEKELALELGVSRPTVRQALGALAARGMVEARPRSGTYVRSAVPAETAKRSSASSRWTPERSGSFWKSGASLTPRRPPWPRGAAARSNSRPFGISPERWRLGPEGLIRHKAGGRAYVRFFSLIAAATGNTLFEHLRETIDRLVRGALPRQPHPTPHGSPAPAPRSTASFSPSWTPSKRGTPPSPAAASLATSTA